MGAQQDAGLNDLARQRQSPQNRPHYRSTLEADDRGSVRNTVWTGAVVLNERATLIAVRAVDAAIARLWPEHDVTRGALVEEYASICGHHVGRPVPARGARQRDVQGCHHSVQETASSLIDRGRRTRWFALLCRRPPR